MESPSNEPVYNVDDFIKNRIRYRQTELELNENTVLTIIAKTITQNQSAEKTDLEINEKLKKIIKHCLGNLNPEQNEKTNYRELRVNCFWTAFFLEVLLRAGKRVPELPRELIDTITNG